MCDRPVRAPCKPRKAGADREAIKDSGYLTTAQAVKRATDAG